MNRDIHDAPSGRADFRDRAVAQSEELLTEMPDVPPRDSGLSLCLVANPDGRRILRWRAIRQLIVILCCIGASIAGLVLAATGTGRGSGEQVQPWLTGLGWGISALGTIGLLTYALLWSLVKRRQLLRVARDRAMPFISEDTALPMLVIELSRCGRGIHLVPPDECLITLDQENQRILMEGISHRYVIYGDDVSAMKHAAMGGEVGVELTCGFGGESLCLQLTHQSLRTHLLSGLGLRPRNRLLEKIEATLFPQDLLDPV